MVPALWIIPSPKAGNPQAVPLAASVVAAIQSLDKYSSFVFPSPSNPQQPREDIRCLWVAVCKQAGITYRVHDLRHSFGLAVRKKHGVSAAKTLLRHSDERVTMKVYAPYDAAEMAAVVESVLGDRDRASAQATAKETANATATVVSINRAREA